MNTAAVLSWLVASSRRWSTHGNAFSASRKSLGKCLARQGAGNGRRPSPTEPVICLCKAGDDPRKTEMIHPLQPRKASFWAYLVAIDQIDWFRPLSLKEWRGSHFSPGRAGSPVAGSPRTPGRKRK